MLREAEVAVFVCRRGRAEILVVHRAPELGGYWHTIAGGIESGEEPEAAASRELEEETGLRVVVQGPAWRIAYPVAEEPPHRQARFAPGVVEVPVHSYLVDAPDDWEPTLDWEHDDYHWCSPDDAVELFRWPDTGASLLRLLATP